MRSFEHVVVIGGGIAGVSAAYFLADKRASERVTLLEAEPQLAFHTTGRSAAILTENYGPVPVRSLTTASLPFFRNPPEDLVDSPLLSKRGRMTVTASTNGYSTFETLVGEAKTGPGGASEIPRKLAQELAPHIRFTGDHRFLWDSGASDIDVAGLHQLFVRGFRRLGGTIETAHRVEIARPSGDGWVVEAAGRTIRCDLIVNAAGAWGDVVAQAADVPSIGLQPMRRTAFMVSSPFADSAHYPFLADAQQQWYLRPDGAQFMCSPADETPSEPCDARPEERDIAQAIAVINENTTLGIRSITSKWAGLRTFAPDRSVVIGPEPTQPDFVWFVGQGGTGIQTAPAAAQLLADLVVDGQPGLTFADIDLDLHNLTPGRLRTA